MINNHFDVIVLGAGPAGYHAALKLAKEKCSVALIEADKVGGVCLNEGCIPSKIFLKKSNLYFDAKKNSKSGVLKTSCMYGHEHVVEIKNEKVKALREHIEADLLSAGITVVRGFGKIRGRTPDDKIEVAVNGNHYFGKHMIISTGSRNAPVLKALTEFKNPIATSSNIFDLTELPGRMLIIGAGSVGLEIADYFSSIGVQVTIVEKTSKLGCKIDSDISIKYQRTLQRKGVNLLFGTEIIKSSAEHVICENNGKQMTIEADLIFLGIGRKANTDSLGLENLSIQLNGCAIKTDKHCRTSSNNVYACGDVNGKSLYAHTAMKEAEIAVNNILGKRAEIDYNCVPSIVYGSTEYACIGKTEEDCIASGIPYNVLEKSLLYSGRYFSENEKDLSHCKLIVHSETNRLLGFQILGCGISEILLSFQVMLYNKMDITQVDEIIFAHPTTGEIIKDICSSY